MCLGSSLHHVRSFLVAAHGLSSCSTWVACEILVPCSGIKPASLALQGRSLTIGPPERSLDLLSLNSLRLLLYPKSIEIFSAISLCFCAQNNHSLNAS